MPARFNSADRATGSQGSTPLGKDFPVEARSLIDAGVHGGYRRPILRHGVLSAMPTPSIFFARRDGIFSEEINEELLVYDTRCNTAHCLSEAAAIAWRTCEGGASLDEITERLSARRVAESRAAAAELRPTPRSPNSLRRDSSKRRAFKTRSGVSRRQALRRIAGVGAGAIAGPMIVSAAVPSSAASGCSPAHCIQLGHTGCTGTGFSIEQLLPWLPVARTVLQ